MPQKQIAELFARVQAGADVKTLDASEKALVHSIIADLDTGKLRVCSKEAEQWYTHEWIKMAILLYFRIQGSNHVQAGDLDFFDKVPTKKWKGDEGVRVVPPAVARFGSFIESGVILMPSFVNIGARVGAGTMVDTWATVGSCAQIGKNVHLSGGVGIGGVLEPLQARPVVVEDNVFIGSRCVVVEGALIEEGAVLGAGVTITGSTKIVDVSGPAEEIHQGRVPAQSVVIPGTLAKKYPAGVYQTPCALIIGKRKPSTDLKTSLNQALRDFGVSV